MESLSSQETMCQRNEIPATKRAAVSIHDSSSSSEYSDSYSESEVDNTVDPPKDSSVQSQRGRRHSLPEDQAT